MLIAFLGIVFISAIISTNRKLSNIAVFLIGGLIGIAIIAIGDCVFLLFGSGYGFIFEFLSLPSITTIILLAYLGQKMNRQASLDLETKLLDWELRASLWLAVIASIGSLAFVVNHEEYGDMLDVYIRLGFALSISLPSAILVGFLIGFVIKKLPRPTFFNWPVWQRANNAIRGAAAETRRRIGNHPFLKLIAVIVLAFGVFSGITYLRLTIPSERELWRISDNNISDPMIVNELLLFKGEKRDFSSRCEYIYAVNKDTGKTAWSSESFTDQYCNRSQNPVFTAVILVSENKDVLFLSSSYWITDDEQDYMLYALNSSTGELLWKVDGYAGYPYSGYSPLDYSSIDTNYIYVANKDGSFSAIDNRTGKPAWKQKFPMVDYREDFLIEYHNQIVYLYYSGDRSLTAFDAKDGTQIWTVSNLNNTIEIIFSDQLAYLVCWSDKTATIDSPNYVIALDTMTGKQMWKFSLGQKNSPWAEIKGNEVYIQTRDSGDSNYQRSLILVNKDTGKLAWQFNADYSHGNINYFVQDNVVYIGTYDDFIFALDERTGKTIWETKASGFPYFFHVEDNTLVVVYEKKYAGGFDIKTGVQKWEVDVGIDADLGTDAFAYPNESIIANNGVMYIAGVLNNSVYAIDMRAGKELWSWDHNYPNNQSYSLKALDNGVLYVDQVGSFLGYDWFFALKTKP